MARRTVAICLSLEIREEVREQSSGVRPLLPFARGLGRHAPRLGWQSWLGWRSWLGWPPGLGWAVRARCRSQIVTTIPSDQAFPKIWRPAGRLSCT